MALWRRTGGDEQRGYPWGKGVIDSSYALYACNANGNESDCVLEDIRPVASRSPKGDGRWGQADVSGSMSEWVLDWSDITCDCVMCVDCACFTVNATSRVLRGGAWDDHVSFQMSVFGGAHFVGDQAPNTGFRCARSS